MGKPTPEGARDFLIPTRLQPGRFFALPQSPQIYKQLLVISGFERYYQIARCFRDEDLRADRLQELTQLDVETAFPDQDELFSLIERVVARIWRECRGVELVTPFPRMQWEEADRRYGSDKPDLRFGLEIEDATAITRGSEFGVFADAAAVRYPAGRPRAVARRAREARGGREAVGRKGPRIPRLSRRRRGPLPDREVPLGRGARARSAGRARRSCSERARRAEVSRVLGFLRLHLGRELGLIDESAWRFLWVTDFPMLKWDPELERWDAEHHPFTRPNPRVAAAARLRPRRGEGDRLRPRRQRARARRRIVPDPRAGAAGEGVRPAPHLARGAAGEVRLPARRARDGRAAARRDRLRDRPPAAWRCSTSRSSATRSRSRRTRPASTRCRARRPP